MPHTLRCDGIELPQKYFSSIINERGEDALTAQSIPKDKSLWASDRYEDFLKERRKIIMRKINDLMKSLEKGQGSE